MRTNPNPAFAVSAVVIPVLMMIIAALAVSAGMFQYSLFTLLEYVLSMSA